MIREKKSDIVAQIEERLNRSTVAILTDYRGLNTAQLTQLRQHLGKQGIEYHIVKNTLTRIAAQNTGRGAVVPLLEGPTAIAFGFGEDTVPPKVLAEYIRSSKLALVIKGGLLRNRSLTPAEVAALAVSPRREVLIAQLLGGMKSPLQGLTNVLAANLSGLLTVLQGRVKQLEGGQNG